MKTPTPAPTPAATATHFGSFPPDVHESPSAPKLTPTPSWSNQRRYSVWPMEQSDDANGNKRVSRRNAPSAIRTQPTTGRFRASNLEDQRHGRDPHTGWTSPGTSVSCPCLLASSFTRQASPMGVVPQRPGYPLRGKALVARFRDTDMTRAPRQRASRKRHEICVMALVSVTHRQTKSGFDLRLLWWAVLGSNQWLQPCEGCTLPLS